MHEQTVAEIREDYPAADEREHKLRVAIALDAEQHGKWPTAEALT